MKTFNAALNQVQEANKNIIDYCDSAVAALESNDIIEAAEDLAAICTLAAESEKILDNIREIKKSSIIGHDEIKLFDEIEESIQAISSVK